MDRGVNLDHKERRTDGQMDRGVNLDHKDRRTDVQRGKLRPPGEEDRDEEPRSAESFSLLLLCSHTFLFVINNQCLRTVFHALTRTHAHTHTHTHSQQ